MEKAPKAAKKGRRKKPNLCTGELDRAQWDQHVLVIGVDEAGRGPLAGPLCVGAVCFPRNHAFEVIQGWGLNDSKKLTELQRRTLKDQIELLALAHHVALAEVEEINEAENFATVLWRTARRAVDEVVNQLKGRWSLTPLGRPLGKDFPKILVMMDGALPIPDLVWPQMHQPKLDGLSFSVAAASVLAKCAQVDRMQEYALKYPGYGFDQHHGYGTAQHLDYIAEHGPLAVHRKWVHTMKADMKKRQRDVKIRLGTADWNDLQE